MLIDLCELSPSYVRTIAPYQPGKPISEVARELGLKEEHIIKLASNENPLGIGPRTRAAIDAALGEISRYPDGSGFELKQALSGRYGVDQASIVLGNGSNDVLELVAAAFLGPGRAAVISQHAFAVYPLATQARGARLIMVPAKSYGHDLEAMARAVRQSVEEYRDHSVLVYVDVVEFDGAHLTRMFGEMADRFQAFLTQYGPTLRLDRLRKGVSPLTAIMVVTRFFFQYFAVEVAFRVPNHFGKDSKEAIKDIVDVLKFGIIKP